MFLNFIDKNQNLLYLIGRFIAVFLIGPILIYKGYIYKDLILFFIGILLILWDGIKLYLQI